MTIVFGSPEAQKILAVDKKLRRPHVELMLCCNDHRNGMHTGRVDGADLMYGGDIALALRGRPLTCKLMGDILQIGHVKVQPITYQTWVGNWCWDSAKLSLDDAARVLTYLRKRAWDCEMGYKALWDIYDDKSWSGINAQVLADALDMDEGA